MKHEVNIKIKKTIYGNIVYHGLLLLYKIGLVTESEVWRLFDGFFLTKKSMKYKVNKSDWLPLDLSEYKLEEVNK